MLKFLKDFKNTVSKSSFYGAVFAVIAPPIIILMNWNKGVFGWAMICLITITCAVNLFMAWKTYKILLDTAATKAKIIRANKE